MSARTFQAVGGLLTVVLVGALFAGIVTDVIPFAWAVPVFIAIAGASMGSQIAVVFGAFAPDVTKIAARLDDSGEVGGMPPWSVGHVGEGSPISDGFALTSTRTVAPIHGAVNGLRASIYFERITVMGSIRLPLTVVSVPGASGEGIVAARRAMQDSRTRFAPQLDHFAEISGAWNVAWSEDASRPDEATERQLAALWQRIQAVLWAHGAVHLVVQGPETSPRVLRKLVEEASALSGRAAAS